MGDCWGGFWEAGFQIVLFITTGRKKLKKKKKGGRARVSTWVVTVGAFAHSAVFIVLIFATAIPPIPVTSVVVVAVVTVFVSFPVWSGALAFCFVYTLLGIT